MCSLHPPGVMNGWIQVKQWLGFGTMAALCSGGPLQVAPDNRTFVTSGGEPFLWMGDTAWELFHRLDREEAAVAPRRDST